MHKFGKYVDFIRSIPRGPVRVTIANPTRMNDPLGVGAAHVALWHGVGAFDSDDAEKVREQTKAQYAAGMLFDERVRVEVDKMPKPLVEWFFTWCQRITHREAMADRLESRADLKDVLAAARAATAKLPRGFYNDPEAQSPLGCADAVDRVIADRRKRVSEFEPAPAVKW